MHCHRTPHADFGAALSFAVSRVRGLLRTFAATATRSPHPAVGRLVCAMLAVTALSACSFQTGLLSLERGTPVADVLRQYGPAAREVAATSDDFHKDVCPGAVTLLYYSDLTGPLGRVIDEWVGGSESVVCVDAQGRVAGTYFVEY